MSPHRGELETSEARSCIPLRASAVCPRCGLVRPPQLVGALHPNRRSVAFVPRPTRVPLPPVEQRNVDDAIGWLDEHWRGGVFMPDELLPLVSAA